MNLEEKGLKELFDLVDVIGSNRYHKLTDRDLQHYRQYDHWRYINSDYDAGTTQVSKDWVAEHSDHFCPVCGEQYSGFKWKTIDHKLPRAQYPWLSMDFQNLWVICVTCNKEKGEMNWYEYERYIIAQNPAAYPVLKAQRPTVLLKALKQ
jgi:hypothetical protein